MKKDAVNVKTTFFGGIGKY